MRGSARILREESRVAPVSDFAAFVHEPPVIEIDERIAIIRYRGGTTPERAMSVRNLQRASDRIQKALRLHAAGESHILVDD
jgi:hypothetical protein